MATYGSEYWIIRKVERKKIKKINAHENWCWRRMLTNTMDVNKTSSEKKRGGKTRLFSHNSQNSQNENKQPLKDVVLAMRKPEDAKGNPDQDG